MDDSLHRIQGISEKRAELLGKELGIYTLSSLVRYYPYRFTDRRTLTKAIDLPTAKQPVQVVAKLASMRMVDGPKTRLQATFTDETGQFHCVWFKGIQWVYKKLRPGTQYLLFGRGGVYGHEFSMVHPEFTAYSPLFAQRMQLEPEYEVSDRLKKSGLYSSTLRSYMAAALPLVLPHTEDYLPDALRRSARLAPLAWALEKIHFPADEREWKLALIRLKFDELFTFQLIHMMQSRAQRLARYAGHQCTQSGELVARFYKEQLPFELTNAQKRVVKEIRHDLGSGEQMNRLVQGDVGSGKTLVALFAMLIAAGNALQSAFMAPTEILAQQHFKSITRFLGPMPVRVALLTGSTTARSRREILPLLADGTIQIIVGTHALIEDQVQFHRLGLIIVDEQHRFGVQQRARMWSKGTQVLPHFLVMSATPIPRTLALTLYGDLDVSSIDELPPGRKPIVTRHVFTEKRHELFNFVRKEVDNGRQAYFVFPLINDSEKIDLESLEAGYARLAQAFPLPEYRLGMLHGRMSSEETEFVMHDFSAGRINILVATTVIEVGVDVPNATIMVIEEAQRFGLSQLHQLRGRVGRGAEASYCFLVTDYKLSQESRMRLDTMVQTNDGFEIAEADLRLRGYGNLGGTQQSGHAGSFRLANPVKDGPLVSFAQAQARMILEQDPTLSLPEHQKLRQHLEASSNGQQNYIKIG